MANRIALKHQVSAEFLLSSLLLSGFESLAAVYAAVKPVVCFLLLVRFKKGSVFEICADLCLFVSLSGRNRKSYVFSEKLLHVVYNFIEQLEHKRVYAPPKAHSCTPYRLDTCKQWSTPVSICILFHIRATTLLVFVSAT